MNRVYNLIAVLCLMIFLVSCGGGQSSPPATEVKTKTYATTLTEINIVRSADKQDIAISGLPADGAILTIDQ